ncbi:hypothetical protein [Aeromonas salmonicida]|jgi:hypothetical protein|uniref:hypothetical protein n=1 Tax=Aeromonas salmonicida TaxID=645 RepID=UPI000BB65389|nr:hypothetical protein [Aeromonas salmonicida]PBO08793.1 hypothetical protein CI710_14315 [Aeromonas salmonicida]
MTKQQDRGELLKEMFPVGKTVDIQLKLTGDQAGFALIGALNDRDEAKDLFFENVSIKKVGFTSYLGAEGGVSSVAAEALLLLDECRQDWQKMETLEQFLLSHAHNGVGKEAA